MLHEAQKGWFDAHAVRAFVRALGVYPLGSDVTLGGGERAQVVAASPRDPTRPVVRITTDAAGRRLAVPKTVDLFRERGFEIVP